MTDPERISKRSGGLAAELLRAGAEERPGDAGIERTLVALGVSSAVVATSGAAGAAAASGVKLTSAGAAGGAGFSASAVGGTAKAVSVTLLAKWIGIGVVGGVGLAGVAAVATAPAVAPPLQSAVAAPPRVVLAVASAPSTVSPQPVAASAEAAPVEPSSSLPAPRVSSSESAPSTTPPVLEVGMPLAAEVAYVDRARALLASGQTVQGLGLLRSYEHEFPEARLLPEVLFLELETLDRLGRGSEARAAAQRLVDGFPKSPHASRARNLLAP